MIYAVTVYCYSTPKLGLVVKKYLALLGVESSKARWNSSPKSISQGKGYSDRKYSTLLPLVMLALSGPEEALQWLLSQFLRYCFCGICGNKLKGLALITWGQKSFFPHWPALHHFFCYHLYWCGDAQKEHNVFYVCTSLIVVRKKLRVLHRHSWRWIFPLTVLAWEAFQKVTLLHPRWHQRQARF